MLALQTLDRLKKGTDAENINAREAIRFIERAGAGSKKISGMNIQTYSDKFASFEDCEIFAKKINPLSQTDDTNLLALQSLSLNVQRRRHSPERGEDRENRPTEETEAILNCALFRMRKLSNNNTESREFMLVSNDPQVVAWARYYGIRSVSVAELAAFVADEEAAFAGRQRQYQFLNGTEVGGNVGRENQNSSRNRGRGARGGYVREISVSPRAMDREDGSFTFNTPKSPTPSSSGGRGRGVSHRTLWEPK